MNKIPSRSDFCIIGGNAVGAKTAATLARRLPTATITLFEKGNNLSYATCGLPYFASGDVDSFAELTKTAYGVARTADFFLNSKGFQAVTGAEIIGINRQQKSVVVKMVQNGEICEHSYGKLVLATGAKPRRPRFPIPESPNIRFFTGPEDAIAFRRKAEKGEIDTVAIVGGGLIGCELAEAMRGMWGINTILLEKENQLLPSVLDPEISAIVKKEMIQNKVDVITGATIEGIKSLNGDSRLVLDFDGENLEADFVFLCLGVEPESTLAQDCGLNLGRSGGIIVDNFMRTSDPDIYAGGDCVETHQLISGKPVFFPMGSLANRHGRIIAENLAGANVEFPGVLGAFLVKIFDLNVGGVGLTEKAAPQDGFNPRAVWGSFPDKPDYYPENKALTLKMVYAQDDSRLLGMQAAGTGDICRRIDVFSSFLQNHSKVKDLFDFEHGYAPPYAEALDPLHHMAAIAEIQESGIDFINPGGPFENNIFWLDVREIEEAAAEPFDLAQMGITGTVLNIPLNELTNRLGELNCAMKIVLLCKRGPRAYQAALILKRAGFCDIHILAAGVTAIGAVNSGKRRQ